VAASVLSSSTRVAGSGTVAGGSPLETTNNCSRAPLSLETFAVNTTTALPMNAVRSIVLQHEVGEPVAELVKSRCPVNRTASESATLTVRLFRVQAGWPCA
jgi:hypothetical protein